MSALTREQVAILRAAGRDRVFARLEVLLTTGQVAASAVLARGVTLLRAAEGPHRIKVRRRSRHA